MIERIAPASTAEVAEAVAAACAAGRRLELIAGGTRRALGRPVMADAMLDLSGLSGIVDYDPSELVLTARPGTPMRDIRAALSEKGQHLAFDPPDHAPLWGGEAGAGTLGGVIGCGLGGPRRIAAGAPRDHVLGFEAVNGQGEVFSAGGKVIKNVTGYDLPKLVTGAFGTLAALTEVTVKVLPAPATEVTLAMPGLAIDRAVAAMALALGSSAAVSAAAHLPRGRDGAGEPLTCVRLEGISVSVAARAGHLAALLGDTVTIDRDESRALWHAIGAVHPFVPDPGSQLWRVSLPASRAPAFLRQVDEAIPSADALLDWGGALVWLSAPPAPDGHAGAIRAALAAVSPGDGHAMLVRAEAGVRAAVPPFQPLDPVLAALTARVKARFDPAGILNPGRMDEGI